MKKLLLYTALCFSLFAACQNKKDNNDGSDGNSSEAKRGISKRDYSITKNNSYSDLFFDSTAMEGYISQNKLADSLAKRMRSFYNTRNYQFAWFSSDGL